MERGEKIKTPELSILLVNFNDRVHLGDCLTSVIESASGFDYEIVIVDNNSSDRSVEFIQKNFPRARLLSNNENFGFSKGNNQAIKQSRGAFILFLNTDTVIDPGALNLLLQKLKSNPELGAIGPALFPRKNVYQVSFGRRVNFLSQVFQKYFFNGYYRLILKISQREREVGWLSAACLLVRRQALEEAGFFDENFFLYFEDIDLCFRVKKRGWKLIYLPAARVFHAGGTTTTTKRLQSRYEYRRSQIYFYQKHNSKISLFLFRFYLRLNFWVLSLKGSFSKEENKGLRSQFYELLTPKKEKE
jgi:GT2 family glycosyltransferase